MSNDESDVRAETEHLVTRFAAPVDHAEFLRRLALRDRANRDRGWSEGYENGKEDARASRTPAVADVDAIARVLVQHRGRSDEDGPPEQLCECGFASEYLISDEFYEATSSYPHPLDYAAEAAALEQVERELEAHQAERIAAYLRGTS